MQQKFVTLEKLHEVTSMHAANSQYVPKVFDSTSYRLTPHTLPATD